MDSDKKILQTENHSPATDLNVEPVIELSDATKALAKRVIRKIDSRILLMMFITYNLNFIDKTILSSAAVFGLRTDNHLVGTEYSWVSSIFYFGYVRDKVMIEDAKANCSSYLFWEYPTSYLIQRLPVGKYLSAVTILWGVFVAITAGCSSFGGLATTRFLLGMAASLLSFSA